VPLRCSPTQDRSRREGCQESPVGAPREAPYERRRTRCVRADDEQPDLSPSVPPPDSSAARAATQDWRSRTTRLADDQEFRASRPDTDLDDVVRNVAQKAHECGDTGVPIEDDLPVFRTAYRDLDPSEYASATSIAMERHFALNWLCGHPESWDETPTDT
jgi:hypothetical protein